MQEEESAPKKSGQGLHHLLIATHTTRHECDARRLGTGQTARSWTLHLYLLWFEEWLADSPIADDPGSNPFLARDLTRVAEW